MESFLTGKSSSAVISALQALLDPMVAHWGDLPLFKQVAFKVMMEGLELSPDHSSQVDSLSEQTLRQVRRLHVQQFRPVWDLLGLEYAYSKLVPTASDSPIRQGFLWLAFQLQTKSIEFLKTDDGIRASTILKKAVDESRNAFQSINEETEGLSLEMMEKIIATLGRKILPGGVTAFQMMSMTGNLLEWARREARSLKDQDLLSTSSTTSSEDFRMLVSLLEPVRHAELKEAHARFLRLDEQARGRRFDMLRKALPSRVTQVAKFAPLGMERFCHAVEDMLFPYPMPIEWMRSYIRPIYTNAQQSSIFDNCLTEPAIEQRYEKLLEEKSANIVMLELSKAMAMAKVSRINNSGQQGDLENLNLHEEFKWPTSLDVLKANVGA